MKQNNPIDIVLENKKFSGTEKSKFHEIISYAKVCQTSEQGNLKSFINQKVEEVVKDEISKN